MIIGGSLRRRPAPTTANLRWIGGTRGVDREVRIALAIGTYDSCGNRRSAGPIDGT
jgi:hypothetical protein